MVLVWVLGVVVVGFIRVIFLFLISYCDRGCG